MGPVNKGTRDEHPLLFDAKPRPFRSVIPLGAKKVKATKGPVIPACPHVPPCLAPGRSACQVLVRLGWKNAESKS